MNKLIIFSFAIGYTLGLSTTIITSYLWGTKIFKKTLEEYYSEKEEQSNKYLNDAQDALNG